MIFYNYSLGKIKYGFFFQIERCFALKTTEREHHRVHAHVVILRFIIELIVIIVEVFSVGVAEWNIKSATSGQITSYKLQTRL